MGLVCLIFEGSWNQMTVDRDGQSPPAWAVEYHNSNRFLSACRHPGKQGGVQTEGSLDPFWCCIRKCPCWEVGYSHVGAAWSWLALPVGLRRTLDWLGGFTPMGSGRAGPPASSMGMVRRCWEGQQGGLVAPFINCGS